MPKKVVRFEAEGSFTDRELASLLSHLHGVAESISARRALERIEISIENPAEGSLQIVNHPPTTTRSYWPGAVTPERRSDGL